MTQPKPGDRIRVTYETVVAHDGYWNGRGLVRTGAVDNAEVEVIWSPARDEKGDE